MEYVKKVLTGAVACGLVMAIAGTARAEGKIAVLDVARLVKAHPKTADDRAVLEKQAEEYREEQRTMLDKLKGLKDDYLAVREAAQNKALSDAARAGKKEELEDKRIALLQYEREIRETLGRREKQLAQQERRMLDRIIERIRKNVTAYTEGKGYALVLDSSALGVNGIPFVLQSEPKHDITEAVLARFEKAAEETGE